MISNPKSPAPGGVNFTASSAAMCFTSASSEPTTAWMFAVAVFALVLDTAISIARAANIHKVRAPSCSDGPVGRLFSHFDGTSHSDVATAHTRERRRPALRVHFTAGRFGSVLVFPTPPSH